MSTQESIAIVTGAASGIGFAAAVRLAKAGHTIVAVDVDADGLARTESAVTSAGAQCRTYAFDIRDEAAFDSLIAEVGTPAVLANVAGVGVAAPAAETSTQDWDRIIGINLTATFTTCRAVLPGMVAAGGGVIVNVGSVAGVVGVRNRAAYCASKGGVIALTRSIAADYAGLGIRVNAICPGTVASEWIGKILADAPDPAAARKAMEERQLDGKMGTPDEVAAGIAFLASEDGRFVNGSAFMMDGGMTAV